MARSVTYCSRSIISWMPRIPSITYASICRPATNGGRRSPASGQSIPGQAHPIPQAWRTVRGVGAPGVRPIRIKLTSGELGGMMKGLDHLRVPPELPMATIADVAAVMQAVLTTTADAAARETGFVRRRSKLGGAQFVQTLVFGWLADAQASLEALSQTAAALGVRVSPQGLDQRFTVAAAAC